MADIRQSVAATISLPGTTWRADNVLDTPKLTFPADETKYCPEILLWVGASADITLKWGAVSGASFYVVQTCENSSFAGPTLRGIRTALVSATLTYIDQVSLGRKIFWRVAAYNAVGSASIMSTSRSFELSCPSLLGTGYDPDDTPGVDKQSCDYHGVEIEIAGPEQVRLTDTDRTWVLNVNYDCKNEAGSTVAIDYVLWTVTQPNAEEITIDTETDNYITLDIAATEVQAFDIKVDVTFSVVGGSDFTCSQTKKVYVEGVAIGGGATSMYFIITEVDCDADSARYLVVTPLRIAPPCVTTPGADSYGEFHVYDDGFGCILDEYTDAELVGLKGKATYASDVDQTYGCVESWTLDGLCDTGSC